LTPDVFFSDFSVKQKTAKTRGYRTWKLSQKPHPRSVKETLVFLDLSYLLTQIHKFKHPSVFFDQYSSLCIEAFSIYITISFSKMCETLNRTFAPCSWQLIHPIIINFTQESHFGQTPWGSPAGFKICY
jgi:hypothetical protein